MVLIRKLRLDGTTESRACYAPTSIRQKAAKTNGRSATRLTIKLIAHLIKTENEGPRLVIKLTSCLTHAFVHLGGEGKTAQISNYRMTLS